MRQFERREMSLNSNEKEPKALILESRTLKKEAELYFLSLGPGSLSSLSARHSLAIMIIAPELTSLKDHALHSAEEKRNAWAKRSLAIVIFYSNTLRRIRLRTRAQQTERG